MKLTKRQRARLTAYRIDPILARQVEEMEDVGFEPCRIDGEVFADELWLYIPPEKYVPARVVIR